MTASPAHTPFAFIDARVRRSFGLASLVGVAVVVAFATPATMRLVTGALAPTEPRLTDAVASAFSGITLPVLGAAIAASTFGSASRLRTRADRIVAAGLAPESAVRTPLLVAIAAASLAAAVAGALLVVLLRLALRLRGPLLFDVAGTAWAMAIGAAAWTALACAIVARSGRPARGAAVVFLDLVTRLLPGAAAWIAPSAHLGNVLGAPPPRGFVHVPVLPQLASVAVLIALAVFGALLAQRRYRGPPPR